MIKLHESQVLAFTDTTESIAFFKNLGPKMIDANAFVVIIFGFILLESVFI